MSNDNNTLIIGGAAIAAVLLLPKLLGGGGDGGGGGGGIVPSMPNITMPEFSMPDINIAMPAMTMPNIEMPNINVEAPIFTMPEINFPEFNFEMPEISFPEFNFEMPEISFPEFNIEMPEINIDFPDMSDGLDVAALIDSISGLIPEAPDVSGMMADLQAQIAALFAGQTTSEGNETDEGNSSEGGSAGGLFDADDTTGIWGNLGGIGADIWNIGGSVADTATNITQSAEKVTEDAAYLASIIEGGITGGIEALIDPSSVYDELAPIQVPDVVSLLPWGIGDMIEAAVGAITGMQNAQIIAAGGYTTGQYLAGTATEAALIEYGGAEGLMEHVANLQLLETPPEAVPEDQIYSQPIPEDNAGNMIYGNMDIPYVDLGLQVTW